MVKLFQLRRKSLFGQILDWMLTPLLLLLPLSVMLSWVVAESIAGRPFDRGLEHNVKALAQLVKTDQQRLLFNLPSPAREILRGLEKLKLPMIMVQIASFMLRYINVISDEMERMKVARESRGFIATGIKHWKVLATAAAALFIRSYERGERVHLAMLSRGFDGTLPSLDSHDVSAREWITAFSIPGLALIASLTALLIGW